MTYGAFLVLFIAIPILILVFRNANRRGQPWAMLAGLAVIALLYTTMWDNYLVANRIWWYSADQVSGLKLGWVPIEEYLFFVLQPLLTGLWTLTLLRNWKIPSFPEARNPSVRWGAVASIALLWTFAAAMLFAGWSTTRYLGLILIWALPPLALQFAYGADILWQQRRLVVLALIPATLYLGAADAFAISNGIWTINPKTSVPVLIGGVLPLEELLFFFVTNCLIVFTVVLVSARSRDTAIETARQVATPS